MKIDINFNFLSDSNGGDPDKTSPTLRSYHQTLWSKELPNGKIFNLNKNHKSAYLYYQSELGEFFLGSDAITHSYKNQRSKQWLIKQLPDNIASGLFNRSATIGSYIIFPNNKREGKGTINQARGMNPLIDDRFDLTLECIRLFYCNKMSPLFNVLTRYADFFELFGSFDGYVDYFYLNDLLDSHGKISFFLPFDNFHTKPGFNNVKEYLTYNDEVINFINNRNKRIDLGVNHVQSFL